LLGKKGYVVVVVVVYARLNGFPICYRHDSVHQKNNKEWKQKTYIVSQLSLWRIWL